MTKDPFLAGRLTELAERTSKLEAQIEAVMAVVKNQGKKIAALESPAKSTPVLIEGKWVRNDNRAPSLNPREFT